MNFFTVLAIFVMTISTSVGASPLLKKVEKDSHFSIQSIDGNGQTIDGVYYSIHHFAKVAAEEACKIALQKCQSASGEQCLVVYESDTLGSTGTLWAPADFLCVAKSETQIAQMKNNQVAQKGLYDNILQHWNELKYHAARFLDPLHQAGGFRPTPDDGK